MKAFPSGFHGAFVVSLNNGFFSKILDEISLASTHTG